MFYKKIQYSFVKSIKNKYRNKMTLSAKDIELLQEIQRKLRRGDITEIAKNTGKTREYVGMVLNPNSDHFNQAIVSEAFDLIYNREQGTAKLLESIISLQHI